MTQDSYNENNYENNDLKTRTTTIKPTKSTTINGISEILVTGIPPMAETPIHTLNLNPGLKKRFEITRTAIKTICTDSDTQTIPIHSERSR